MPHGSILGRRWLVAVVAVTLFAGAHGARAGGDSSPFAFTLVHAFTGGADGAQPMADLTIDVSGTLYGTTEEGGALCPSNPDQGCGTVFALDAAGTPTPIHIFTDGTTGVFPFAGVTLARGTLFGGSNGGTDYDGILFSVKTDGSDYAVLHSFVGTDGAGLTDRLQQSVYGGFVGVSASGGPGFSQQTKSGGNGVLFYLQPDGTYVVTHQFAGGADGAAPSNVRVAPNGTVFGSTSEGGTGCAERKGCGTIFEYVPATHNYRVLYAFTDAADGKQPYLGSIGPDGTLYGATGPGSATAHGTLFALVPSANGYSFATLASIVSNERYDYPTSGPLITPGGALVGQTPYQLYGYRNGAFASLVHYSLGNDSPPQGEVVRQPTLARNGTIYGITLAGGLSPCVLASGFSFTGGCGEVFSYTDSPAP